MCESRLEFFQKNPSSLFFLAVLLCLPIIWLDDIPARDVASRYAPMADAFVRGDWKYAFHPKVPGLVTTLAGIVVWLTNCGGFTACKIVSCLFFALTVYPLYGIMKLTFDRKIAFVAVVMTVFCSHLMRLAYSGLRDTAKGFAFILAVYGLILLYRNRNHFAGYLTCAVGAGMLLLTKGDCALYAVLLVLAGMLFELYFNSKWHFPFRSFCGCVLILLITLPTLYYNYQKVGYPVPEVRIGIVMSKIVPFIKNENAEVQLPSEKNKNSEIKKVEGVPQKHKKVVVKRYLSGSFSKFFHGLVKGFYPYFFVFALPVIFFRIRRKKWKPEETIILSALMGHALLLVLQIMIFDHALYVSRRYLLPVAPLAFGWSALCIMQLWNYLSNRFSVISGKKVKFAVPVILAVLLYADACLPMLKSYLNAKKSGERDAILKVANWIKGDYYGKPKEVDLPLIWDDYRSNQRPLVWSLSLGGVGYLSGGQDYRPHQGDPNPDYVVIESGKNGARRPFLRKEKRLI